MDAIETIRTRRSIGRLGGEVTDEELRTLVEAGLWAPNHKLTDPFRFVALRGAARERLGRAWAEVAATFEPPPGVTREAFVEKEARKPLRARSSVGEHPLHTRGVVGSIPTVPTSR